MAASSPPPVTTYWPFLAFTMAVPVSWQDGRTPPAAMDAFFNSSRATKRSLADASGSSRIDESWARCPGRSRWAMSRMAWRVSRVMTSGSTRRNRSPPASKVDTPSLVSSR